MTTTYPDPARYRTDSLVADLKDGRRERVYVLCRRCGTAPDEHWGGACPSGSTSFALPENIDLRTLILTGASGTWSATCQNCFRPPPEHAEEKCMFHFGFYVPPLRFIELVAMAADGYPPAHPTELHGRKTRRRGVRPR